MEQGDVSSLGPVPSHVGGVARGAHPRSGLAVGTGKARGLLCQGTVNPWVVQSYVFGFLNRDLCDHGLSVCCKVDQLFLQGNSGHFSQHGSGGDWQRFDFIAVSLVRGILHDESLHYLKLLACLLPGSIFLVNPTLPRCFLGLFCYLSPLLSW